MAVSADHLRALAMAQRGTEERQEGGMALFVAGDRIFAALVSETSAILNLREDQRDWLMGQSDAFGDADGKTSVDLTRVELELLADFVVAAHANVTKNGLAALGALLKGEAND